jgi:hypothetical protein
MKSLLTLLLAFLCVAAKSQTLIDKKDEFTGRQIKGAIISFMPKVPLSLQIIYGYENLVFSELNSKKTIMVILNLPAGQFGVFNGINVKNLSVLIKMESDTLIRFKADSSFSKITNAGNNSIASSGAYISDKQLLYFTNNKVKAIRLVLNNEDMGIDLPMTDKRSIQIQKAAVFMLGMKWFDDEDKDAEKN